jgi:hypothetical protein
MGPAHRSRFRSRALLRSAIVATIGSEELAASITTIMGYCIEQFGPDRCMERWRSGWDGEFDLRRRPASAAPRKLRTRLPADPAVMRCRGQSFNCSAVISR